MRFLLLSGKFYLGGRGSHAAYGRKRNEPLQEGWRRRLSSAGIQSRSLQTGAIYRTWIQMSIIWTHERPIVLCWLNGTQIDMAERLWNKKKKAKKNRGKTHPRRNCSQYRPSLHKSNFEAVLKMYNNRHMWWPVKFYHSNRSRSRLKHQIQHNWLKGSWCSSQQRPRLYDNSMTGTFCRELTKDSINNDAQNGKRVAEIHWLLGS